MTSTVNPYPIINMAVLSLVTNATRLPAIPIDPVYVKKISPVKKLRRHRPKRNDNFGYMRSRRGFM